MYTYPKVIGRGPSDSVIKTKIFGSNSKSEICTPNSIPCQVNHQVWELYLPSIHVLLIQLPSLNDLGTSPSPSLRELFSSSLFLLDFKCVHILPTLKVREFVFNHCFLLYRVAWEFTLRVDDTYFQIKNCLYSGPVFPFIQCRLRNLAPSQTPSVRGIFPAVSLF